MSLIKTIGFLVIFSSLLSLDCLLCNESSQITFQKATSDEIIEIQQKMAIFYGEELYQAKVFENRHEALNAAIEECRLNNVKETIFINIVSKAFGHKCGYFVYSINQSIAHIDAIYLEKNCRGKGFGKQCLIHFEAELKNINIKKIELYVFAHNHSAIKLYEKMGYSVEHSYPPIGYFMQKQLF